MTIPRRIATSEAARPDVHPRPRLLTTVRPPSPPTRRELEALAMATLYTEKEAAVRMGLRHAGVKSLLRRLYERFDEADPHDLRPYRNRFDVLRALGWLRIPDEYVA